jgi:hypothetical protein
MSATTLVSARIQVRMVDESGRVLRLARFMDLLYDPAVPFEVRLADPAGSEMVLARGLLETVLREGRADGDGDIQLYLAFQQQSPLLLLTRPGACPFAFRPASVAAFLARTADLVDLNVDHELEVLLGHAA